MDEEIKNLLLPYAQEYGIYQEIMSFDDPIKVRLTNEEIKEFEDYYLVINEKISSTGLTSDDLQNIKNIMLYLKHKRKEIIDEFKEYMHENEAYLDIDDLDHLFTVHNKRLRQVKDFIRLYDRLENNILVWLRIRL